MRCSQISARQVCSKPDMIGGASAFAVGAPLFCAAEMDFARRM